MHICHMGLPGLDARLGMDAILWVSHGQSPLCSAALCILHARPITRPRLGQIATNRYCF